MSMEIYKAIYLASHILLLSCSVHNTLPHSDSKIHSGWNVFQEQITIQTAIDWTQFSVLPHLYHFIWYNVVDLRRQYKHTQPITGKNVHRKHSDKQWPNTVQKYSKSRLRLPAGKILCSLFPLDLTLIFTFIIFYVQNTYIFMQWSFSSV